MTYNSNQTALGFVDSNLKEVRSKRGTLPAGVVATLQADGALVTGYQAGILMGISLGQDLSNAGYCPICVKGVNVPVRLAEGFTPTVGTHFYFDQETGEGAEYLFDADLPAILTQGLYTKILSDGGLPEGGGTPVPAALIDYPDGL